MAVIPADATSTRDNVRRYEWQSYTPNAGGSDVFEIPIPQLSYVAVFTRGATAMTGGSVQGWYVAELGDATSGSEVRLDWFYSIAATANLKTNNIASQVEDYGATGGTAGIGGYYQATQSGNRAFRCPPGVVRMRILATGGIQDIFNVTVIALP